MLHSNVDTMQEKALIKTGRDAFCKVNILSG
jgi:hypothetical protein